MKLISKEIKVKESKVSYIDEGSGIPIIFIHGFPFNKWMWEKQVLSLKDKYRCIAYDIQGHGDSTSTSAEFSISQFADDLIGFMGCITP